MFLMKALLVLFASLALTPLENRWWNVTLLVTPLGLTTSAIPYPSNDVEVEFDFSRIASLSKRARGPHTAFHSFPGRSHAILDFC
jgi:hypothetical protein